MVVYYTSIFAKQTEIALGFKYNRRLNIQSYIQGYIHFFFENVLETFLTIFTLFSLDSILLLVDR